MCCKYSDAVLNCQSLQPGLNAGRLNRDPHSINPTADFVICSKGGLWGECSVVVDRASQCVASKHDEEPTNGLIAASPQAIPFGRACIGIQVCFKALERHPAFYSRKQRGVGKREVKKFCPVKSPLVPQRDFAADLNARIWHAYRGESHGPRGLLQNFVLATINQILGVHQKMKS